MTDQTKRASAAPAGMRTTAPAGFRVSPDHIDSKPGEGLRMWRRPVADDPNKPKETGVVRSGRSVHVGTEEKHLVGRDPVTGAEVYAAAQIFFGPGQTVTLPRSEIIRLRGLGFLVDPDDEPVFTSGPLS
jgi:hypothetical protein